jgi:ADP-ribose pyrophosphatase YjhB (NUDIX family)
MCPKCGYVLYQNPKPVITAIIEKNGKVLFGKRSKDPYFGKWDLIGGFVDVGETLEEAVAREVKEESGLEVSSSTFYFNHTDIYKNAADGHITYNLAMHFLVEVKDGPFKPGDDIGELAWFSWDDLPQDIARFHDVLAVIKKRQEELKNSQS